MERYRGLTWDHPRGHGPLRAAETLAVEERGIAVDWDIQPLEGFESCSLTKVCDDYDLIVIDHPHLGEAVAQQCLRPASDILGAAECEAIGREAVGPSGHSYLLEGKLWALPIDAATQVLCRRPDLAGREPLETWVEIAAASRRMPVALSLAGPHAANTFFSITASCVGEEDPHAQLPPFMGPAGEQALEIMVELFGRMPPAAVALNPIEMLTAMARTNAIAICPLIFGYVTFARPAAGTGAHALEFLDAPASQVGGRRGSTLGGAGLAFTRRCPNTCGVRQYARWITSATTQREFIPLHGGQPSHREAWYDEAVNRASASFYRNTVRTIEQAWVRPRHAGFVRFQSLISAQIAVGLQEGRAPGVLLKQLQTTYRAHWPIQPETVFS